MTTPAQNTTSYSNVVAHYSAVDRWTGAPMSSGDVVWGRISKRDVRPQSVSNPKRSDNTRRNGPWNHRWASLVEEGSYFRDYSGTSTDITTTGQLVYWGHEGPPDTSSVGPLMRNCRLAALSKGTRNVAQASAALRQSREIVDMVGDYTRRAARGLDNLMGRDGLHKLRGPMSTWKEIPSEYLRYLYGIAPLGDDIANGLDELSAMNDYGMKMTMILKASKRLNETRRAYNGIRHGTGLRDIYYEGKSVTGVRVGYRFDLPSWFMDNVPIIAPFSTQYELARYSFILDWILPVGDWIGALESAQFSPYFVEGWEVWKVQETYDLSTAV